MKACFKCGAVKSIEDFYPHKRMADGHLNKCKDCTKEDVRRDRRISEHAREYDNKRSLRPERLAMYAANTKRYRQKHPLRASAMDAANNAVRDGLLAKEPCLFCGSTENLHKHHRDYSKPLDVIWLCARCHRRLHANFPQTVAEGETTF